MNVPSRRRFLSFLAASPAITWAQQISSEQKWAIVTSAQDALNVKDFEEIAQSKLPPAHWGYLVTGVDDDRTTQANMAAFERIELRPRRLVDVSHTDIRTELFGTVFDAPIFLCPVSYQKMFHPTAELGSARAAKSKKTMQILSMGTSVAFEEVTKALGSPPWAQFDMPLRWEDTEKAVKRVEDAGCPVLVMTVDGFGGRNAETQIRLARTDTRNCLGCHPTSNAGRITLPAGSEPMMEGIVPYGSNPHRPTWEDVDRLKKLTRMKLVLKGIETSEDARLCKEHGVDAIEVSNHGGRATEDLRPTVDSLPEVIDGAGSQMKILVDGGFRRGADVYKALAMGASAVGIGRPYIYGLTGFGQEGVERVLDILRTELLITMRACGTPTLAQITPASIAKVPQPR
ncbi:MAG: alpha-hydroxy-acid oxidizing protein [Bryobacterales bacterium]|nr:alpha-hydroxy-acid oxidizing protein [Bryobacterales bacterium]